VTGEDLGLRRRLHGSSAQETWPSGFWLDLVGY
jgi:hypothetical protein